MSDQERVKMLWEMWISEVEPLAKELELREYRANHIDRASEIREISERFESCFGDLAREGPKEG